MTRPSDAFLTTVSPHTYSFLTPYMQPSSPSSGTVCPAPLRLLNHLCTPYHSQNVANSNNQNAEPSSKDGRNKLYNELAPRLVSLRWPVVTATWNAEAGGFKVQGLPVRHKVKGSTPNLLRLLSLNK